MRLRVIGHWSLEVSPGGIRGECITGIPARPRPEAPLM